jgi:hypothetical protein
VINIAQALQIRGWMSEPELYFLAEQAQKHKTIIEAGSYCGRSTRAMADNTDGIVHAIDPWDGQRQYYGNIVHQNGDNNIFNQFVCNLNGYIRSCKVVIYISNFHNVHIDRPDMVFIDAIHEYTPLKRDINHALKLMHGKGLLCGHDYSSGWPEVIEVVDEMFGKVNVCDSIWYVEL